jgi:hypothetical protein
MQLKKYQFSGNFDWFVTGLAANAGGLNRSMQHHLM